MTQQEIILQLQEIVQSLELLQTEPEYIAIAQLSCQYTDIPIADCITGINQTINLYESDVSELTNRWKECAIRVKSTLQSQHITQCSLHR